MPKDKSTGKKLADMMYGNPERAAFGVFPQMKPKRSKQDPEAAKNFPVDLARGVVAGALGIPGDIESLARLPYELYTGNDSPTFLPTSEDVLKRIPFGSDTPASQFAAGLGTLAGGSANLGAIPRAVKAAPGALKQAKRGALQAGMKLERGMEPVVKKALESGGLPREMVMAMGANTQSNVIKPKGGNWLGGRLMGNMDENVKRLKPYSKAGAQAGWQQKELEGAQASLERLKNDKYTSPRMVELQQGVVDEIKKKIAINNWVESNLGKYVKNQMATPEDPIRLLLDKRTKEIETKHAKDLQRAERVAQRAMDESDPRRQANMIRESERLKMEANVERQFAMDSIIPSRMQDYSPEADYYLKQRRQDAGFPAEGMGESEAAKRYETLTDDAISTMRAGDVQGATRYMPELQDAEREFLSYRQDMMKRFEDHLRASGMNDNEVRVLSERAPAKEKAQILGDDKFFEMSNDYSKKLADFDRDAFSTGQENPFIAKLDPETQIYSGNTADMGFDHVIDILKQDVMEGRIRPEQLNKVSVEDAVRRTMEFDQEAARKMAEAQIKNMEGFPVYKEYPEGYRWVELKKPEDLPEGYSLDEMGNVVDEKGHLTNHPGEKRLEEALKYEGDTMGHCVGGYCPDVLEGKSRIFSLRDAKGEPHVTVEVGPVQGRTSYDDMQAIYNQAQEEANAKNFATTGEFNNFYNDRVKELQFALIDKQKAELPERIVQIKGKQNAAPKAEYLPYVQDFVKSGTYSDVGDLQNTGLMPIELVPEKARYEAAGMTLPKYVTPQERDELLNEYNRLTVGPPDWDFMTKEYGFPPPEEGMARGGRVHISDNPDVMALELQAGGLVKGIKAAAKAAKAKVAAAPEKELTLPSKLPRATPRTKEDLRPYAQQMAEATRGDFYRPDPAKSVNPAGKSFEQFKMEQGLVHDIRPTAKFQTLPRSNIEDQKGMVKMGISGDTTVAEQVLHEAGPYALDLPSPQHGGALYGLGGEGAWASNNPIAKNVQERINEISQAYGDAPVLGQYMQMGKLGSDFALHFADANLRAIDLSKMSKSQIESVDELIRKGSKKSGARPSFPGIEDKESAYLHFAVDPELRKHFNAIMQKPTYTEPLGLPDGRIIHHAITEPELRNLPVTTTGFSQMELQPGFDPLSLELSAHPTYSHVIPHKPNTNLTRTRVHIPAPVEFPDVTEYLLKTGPRKYDASDMTRMYQTATPRQIVDQQHIDEIKMFEELMKEYGGKKKGGAVKVEQKVQVPKPSQKKSEQRVQNPVHFTENPDAMRLALTQRN